MSLGSVMGCESIRARMEKYTGSDNYLYPGPPSDKADAMQKAFTFREILIEAVRHNRSMWEDGELNLTAIARYYQAHGAEMTQPNLHRLVKGTQKPGEKAVAATHKAFGIPKYLVRGEPVSAEMDELLTSYRLSTVLLAKRLESLPKDQYEAIAHQVDVMYEAQRQFRLDNPKVTSIDRRRPA